VARVVIDVMLKPEILDPQGRAVEQALTRQGLTGVQHVRQGKHFVVEVEGDLTPAILAELDRVAAEVLSNPVIEDYVVRVEDDAVTVGNMTTSVANPAPGTRVEDQV
jgi:phosphoribosylformylglycinamidine synthase